MSNFGSGSLWPWLRLPPPPEDLLGFQLGSGDPPGLSNWRPPMPDGFKPGSDGTLPTPEVAPSPWWELPSGTANAQEGGPEPNWPWLRAPTDEIPGFRLNPDGTVRTGELGSDVRLMSGAFAPIDPQKQPDDVAGNGMTSPEVVPLPPPGTPPASALATSLALPASAGGAVDLGALAASAASAVGGAASAAVSALPLMLIPTNTQSETTDLDDGLRARVRPGQRTAEIEQRVDNGFLGTGIGTTWKTLPVDANVVVGRDGASNIVLNHEQLNRVLGRSAPAEAMDAGGSAMAQPPKDVAPGQLPPTGIDSGADKAYAGNPPSALSVAPGRITAKVLEEAKQRDPEEERVLACRAVRAMPRVPPPQGQYNGPGSIDTAVGVRVAPGFPAPKGGYGYDPDYLRHWNGYRGELELKNRIEKAVPYEKIVHYGNPAGDQGPDVLTIGPDDNLMEWNSKSRSVPRRVGRSMTGIPSLKYGNAKAYVDGAVNAGALAKHVGDAALNNLSAGNYNVCTVGTGNAYDGYFETVRNHTPSGPQR